MDTKKNFRHFLLLSGAVFLIVTSGCRMTASEYQQWEQLTLRQNSALAKELDDVEKQTSISKDKLYAIEEESQFLTNKSLLLRKENAALTDYWKTIRVDARSTYSNIVMQINKNKDLAFDIQYGDPVRKLTKCWQNPQYTVIVDFNRQIQENCHIQAVEIFSSKGTVSNGSNKFQVLLFRKNTKGGYSVHSASPPFSIAQTGRSSYAFLHAPMRAQKGDCYGLLVHPNTSIDYNELNLGKTHCLSLDNYNGNPLEIAVEMPHLPSPQEAKPESLTKSFAFSVWGTSGQP